MDLTTWLQGKLASSGEELKSKSKLESKVGEEAGSLVKTPQLGLWVQPTMLYHWLPSVTTLLCVVIIFGPPHPTHHLKEGDGCGLQAEQLQTIMALLVICVIFRSYIISLRLGFLIYQIDLSWDYVRWFMESIHQHACHAMDSGEWQKAQSQVADTPSLRLLPCICYGNIRQVLQLLVSWLPRLQCGTNKYTSHGMVQLKCGGICTNE